MGIDKSINSDYTQVPTCEITLKLNAGLGTMGMKQGHWNGKIYTVVGTLSGF